MDLEIVYCPDCGAELGGDKMNCEECDWISPDKKFISEETCYRAKPTYRRDPWMPI